MRALPGPRNWAEYGFRLMVRRLIAEAGTDRLLPSTPSMTTETPDAEAAGETKFVRSGNRSWLSLGSHRIESESSVTASALLSGESGSPALRPTTVTSCSRLLSFKRIARGGCAADPIATCRAPV